MRKPILGLCLSLILLQGCASSAVVRLKREFVETRSTLKKVQVEVDEATRRMNTANILLGNVVVKLDKADDTATKVVVQDQKKDAVIAKTKTDFFSYRQKMLALKIVLGVVGYFLVAAVLRWVATLGLGGVFTVALKVSRFMLNLPTLFTSYFFRKQDKKFESQNFS